MMYAIETFECYFKKFEIRIENDLKMKVCV